MVAEVGCGTMEGVEPASKSGNKMEESAAQRLLVKRAMIKARKNSRSSTKNGVKQVTVDATHQEDMSRKKKKKKKKV